MGSHQPSIKNTIFSWNGDSLNATEPLFSFKGEGPTCPDRNVRLSIGTSQRLTGRAFLLQVSGLHLQAAFFSPCPGTHHGRTRPPACRRHLMEASWASFLFRRCSTYRRFPWRGGVGRSGLEGLKHWQPRGSRHPRLPAAQAQIQRGFAAFAGHDGTKRGGAPPGRGAACFLCVLLELVPYYARGKV